MSFDDFFESESEVGTCADCVHFGALIKLPVYPAKTVEGDGVCKNVLANAGNKKKTDTCSDFTPWPEVNTEGEYVN